MLNCKDCIHYEMCSTLNTNGSMPFGDPAKCSLYDTEPETITVGLPCRVGTTVWFIWNNDVIETSVEKFVIKAGGLYMKLACNAMYETSCRSIGKTVFFSREAAERKLT